MKTQYVKCTCDYCNTDMPEWEYNTSTKISIRVNVPNTSESDYECNGMHIVICNKCSEDAGIIKSEIHTGHMYPESRLLNAITKNKEKIINMIFNTMFRKKWDKSR